MYRTFSQFNNHTLCLGKEHCCAGPEPGNQLTLVISLPIWLLTAELLSPEYHRLRLPAVRVGLGGCLLRAPAIVTSLHSSISLTIYVMHLAGDEIPSPVHIFTWKENNLSVTGMSDLLIICVTVLCLQVKANIVCNK